MNNMHSKEVEETSPQSSNSGENEFNCCFNKICTSKGQCCLSTLCTQDTKQTDQQPGSCILNKLIVQNEYKTPRCFGSLCDQCETTNKCLFDSVLTIPPKEIEFVGVKTEHIELPGSPECCMLSEQNKPFDCSKCKYKTDVKRNLQRHLLTHSDAKLFKCTKCNYTATQKHHLQQHMITHCEQISDCTNCKYKCKIEQDQPVLPSTKPYICVECDYRAATKHHLQQHVASHMTEKVFKCSSCDYTTTRRYNLQQHMLIHEVEKPFRCSDCDYSTTRKYHLQNHMSSHTGEKPFQCSECDYKTALKRSLLLHTLTHSGKQPLECIKCNYKCSTKASLTKHVKVHSREIQPTFDY